MIDGKWRCCRCHVKKYGITVMKDSMDKMNKEIRGGHAKKSD